MKRIHLIISVVAIALVGFFVFSKLFFIGKKLEISFVKAQRHSQSDLAYKGCVNDFEWIIICEESQRRNLMKEGYTIPDIDFSKNYLIISRYKISRLYQKACDNPYTGVPDGLAVFDKKNSNEDFYYFYLIPRVKLSQGVG